MLTAAQATILAALIAGLFGGVVGNLVKARLDEASGNRRLRLERRLNRQERVLEQQAKLLDDLTEASWAWRYVAVRLAYEGNDCTAPWFDAALEAYRGERWPALHRMRALASRARRLVSEDAHGVVVALYGRAVDIDLRLENAADQQDPISKAIEFGEINHELVNQITPAIDDLLLRLAQEVRLVSSSAQRSANDGDRGAP